MPFDLVFEGGGAKGMAFVGAMEAFNKHGLSYGRLMGTSAGAITATLLAAAYSVEEMRTALEETTPDGTPIFETFLGQPRPFDDEELAEGAFQKLLTGIDWAFLPEIAEHIIDDLLLGALAKQPPARNLVSLVERGGWFGAEEFLVWISRMLDQGEFDGQPRRFSHMTMSEYFAATSRDLTLIAADTSSGRMLVLNHRTAPDCPVVWAVRMSMSVPLIWEEVIWRASWGKYRGKVMTNHTIVDGGLLSNFPIELFISDAPMVTDLMGEPTGNEIIGFLLDETLAVPQPTAAVLVDIDIKPMQLATVQRLLRLANAATNAHDKAVIDAFEHLVVRLPARDYGTTEFDMDENKRAALVAAAYHATDVYLKGLTAGIATSPIFKTPEDMATEAALRMLGD